MPALRTEITEIVTGLAMLGGTSPAEVLSEPIPAQVKNVSGEVWHRLRNALDDENEAAAFTTAWANGQAFAVSDDGLRGRVPLRIEWKGPQQQTGYEFLPVDLRIDHVYLVSCKYLSKVLSNSSPDNLFRHCLSQRGAATQDWFTQVAPEAYEAFYAQVRDHLHNDAPDLPADSASLTAAHRETIGELCSGTWHVDLKDGARAFSLAVAEASIEVWRESLQSHASKEIMLWRMLRFGSAPYFVLGTSGANSLRLRVATPWDWRQQFQLLDFELSPGEGVQPVVDWQASVLDRESGMERHVSGYVEVRWSHGRFCGFPEAKVYLRTPHHQVPGYFQIA